MSIKKYFTMVKFAHTIFAMPFAIVGYFLGITAEEGKGGALILILVILCMFFARNAAMGFNRYIDRTIDAKNPRTEGREIPLGTIQPQAALAFVIANALAFVITCWFINKLVFFLSPVALFVILGYSFTKNYTVLCHFVLGIGLSLAPIGAYLAVTGTFALLPAMFSLVVLLWSGGFDIIYALQDREFDIRERIYSIPAQIGIRRALVVSGIVHVAVGVLIVIIWIFYDFRFWYATGAVLFLSLLLYQHLIVKPDDMSRINAAFFKSNGVASVAFSIFIIIDLIYSA